MKKKLKIRIEIISLFTFAIILLLIPFFIRFFNNEVLFTGGEFYYDLRTSRDLSNDIYWDSLENRLHKTSLFHYFLSFSTSFTETKYIIVSLAFGVLSLFMFFMIIKHFFENRDVVIVSSFLFVLSPVFVYLFTSLNTYSLATLLSLFFIYFFINKNYWSVPFLMLVSITDFSFFLIDVILIIFYYFYTRERMFFLGNLISAIISFLLFSYYHKGFRIFENLFSSPSFIVFFTSFGAEVGIAFFYLFLGLIGFFTIWKRRREYIYFLVSIIAVLLFSLFNEAGRIFLNFYLCLLAGIIVLFLIRRKWAIITIKKFTLLLIFCGIIFSTSLYIDQIIKSEPKNELIESLSYLKNQESGVVLSHQSYGYFIEYFSDKQSYLDDSSVDYSNYFPLKDVEQKIFYSRNLETTQSLLEENGIEYILVTSEMKKGIVWKRESEGLLFLLENSLVFEKIHSTKGIEVWKVLYE
ncbi:MAG: hypothetical protein H8D38_06700 [DPANN group archaeon]|nr:hypothetical protein [DPANN group archaeon]